eukprot:gene14714-biopygen5369
MLDFRTLLLSSTPLTHTAALGRAGVPWRAREGTPADPRVARKSPKSLELQRPGVPWRAREGGSAHPGVARKSPRSLELQRYFRTLLLSSTPLTHTPALGQAWGPVAGPGGDPGASRGRQEVAQIVGITKRPLARPGVPGRAREGTPADPVVARKSPRSSELQMHFRTLLLSSTPLTHTAALGRAGDPGAGPGGDPGASRGRHSTPLTHTPALGQAGGPVAGPGGDPGASRGRQEVAQIVGITK